jgi:hypothetical protein
MRSGSQISILPTIEIRDSKYAIAKPPIHDLVDRTLDSIHAEVRHQRVADDGLDALGWPSAPFGTE